MISFWESLCLSLSGKRIEMAGGNVQEEAMKENDIGRKNIIFILYVGGVYYEDSLYSYCIHSYLYRYSII